MGKNIEDLHQERIDNANKMNSKRIIAREGLVIIGICLLFAVAMYFDGKERSNKYEYGRKAQIVEVVEVTLPANSDESKEPWEAVHTERGTGIYVMAQKPIDPTRLVESLKRDFPKVKNPSYIEGTLDPWMNESRVKRYYDDSGNEIKFVNYDTTILVVILLYPVYLLVRFILWAIKTLKQ